MHRLWEHSCRVAALLRESPEFRGLASGFEYPARERTPVQTALMNVFAGFSYLSYQPLFFGHRIRVHSPEANQIAGVAGGREFLDFSFRVAAVAITMTEWLRSAISGYPNLLVPHIEVSGRWVTSNWMNAGIPWEPDLRQVSWGTSDELVRDGFPLTANRAQLTGLSDALGSLRSTLLEQEALRGFASLRESFSEDQLAFLEATRSDFAREISQDRLQAAVGPTVEMARRFIAAKIRSTKASAPKFAQDYYAAFEAVDRTLEDVMLVIAGMSVATAIAGPPAHRRFTWDSRSRHIKLTLPLELPIPRVGSLLGVVYPVLGLTGAGLIEGTSMSSYPGGGKLELTIRVLQQSERLLNAITEGPAEAT